MTQSPHRSENAARKAAANLREILLDIQAYAHHGLDSVINGAIQAYAHAMLSVLVLCPCRGKKITIFYH